MPRLLLSSVALAAPLALATTAVAAAANDPHAAGADTPAEAADTTEAADAPEEAEETGARWALGIGPGVVNFPDYVGSDERQTWVLPVPYVTYESRHLRFRRGVLSGVLELDDRTRFDASLGGSLPVRSSDNRAREGMPDLLTTVEIGPSLEYDLWGSRDTPDLVTVELPVRGAIGFNLSRAELVGWVTSPNVEYRRRQPLADGRLTLRVNTGPLFNSESYNAYFYQVRKRDARPDRPAYDADAGYGGWRLSGSVGWRWGELWVGAFGRYIDLHGAAFEDSPLVKTRSYLMGGIGTAWIFASSGEDED